MILKLVTPATTYPVSLAEVKNHLRLPSTYESEDERLQFFIKAAVKYAEDKTNRQLLTATWRADFDKFTDPLVINKCPVIAVSTLKYYNDSGTLTTLTSTNYNVDTDSEPWRIEPAYGYSWPSARAIFNAVQVTFTAGYSSVSTVPANIKAGIMLIIGDLWRNRENVVIGRSISRIPVGADELFLQERVMWYE